MLRNLFLLEGAAGTGKSDLVEYIVHKYQPTQGATIVRKFTTRKKRPEEGTRKTVLDLDFISRADFAANQATSDFYFYEYSGHLYGFSRKTLDDALARFPSVFIIVRDRELMRRLIEDYREINVVPVFVYSDNQQIKARLKTEGYKPSEIAFRTRRNATVWEDYLKQTRLYKHVLVNNSDKADFCRLIDDLVDLYSSPPPDTLVLSKNEQFPLIPSLVGFKTDMESRLERHPYENNVFLMMKFRESNKRVSDFIKKQLRENGFECVRADDHDWDITRNTHNPIAVLYCCKYGIALFDEPEKGNNFSPNVAYELGMMHLQMKNCLILRHQTLPEVPFNLVKDLHKTYSEVLQLEDLIREWVREIKQAE